ncbi:MAG: glycosyltransferase family 4 protein [Minisyncoccia bacterium]
MKLLYIAHIRLPTEKAHGIQIMEMCSAFVAQGLSVELVVPKRRNPITDDPFTYHDIKPTFGIRVLPSFDFIRFGRIGFLIGLLSFTASMLGYVLFRKGIFYTRDEFVALCLYLLGKQVVWEGHTGQKSVVVWILLRLHVPIVVITEALRELYVSLGARASTVLVAPDGADISRFNIPLTQAEARKELNLPLDAKIVLYKGHLYERKGAHTLARAARRLADVLCVFIGGTEEDVASFRKEFGDEPNVRILGNRPRHETPIYQKAADILVIPNSAKDDVSKLYTSPMKLFGYMASGVPVVASDLPSLREIVDESMVYFFTPDDSESLAHVIANVLKEYPIALKKAEATFAIAKQYSWDTRAEHILSFIHRP